MALVRSNLNRLHGRFAIVLGCLLLAAAAPAQAKLYKWVDAQGRVYYTDTPPPQSSGHAVTEMGKAGQAMKRTESLEERRVREAQERRAAEQKKIAEEQARKDRALLGTYTRESEIDLARDRALEHHRLAIVGAQTRLKQIAVKVAELNDKIKAATSRGKPVPPHLQNQLFANEREVRELKQATLNNQQALVDVRAKYDADKARFRELDEKTKGSPVLPVAPSTLPGVAPSASQSSAK